MEGLIFTLIRPIITVKINTVFRAGIFVEVYDRNRTSRFQVACFVLYRGDGIGPVFTFWMISTLPCTSLPVPKLEIGLCKMMKLCGPDKAIDEAL